jgi:hypothetical protein
MPLDRARLGNLASAQMEALEHAYEDDSTAEIYSAISIVEIVQSEGNRRTRNIRVRFDTDGDILRLVAVLRSAEMQILESLGQAPAEGEADE